jgi:nucleotidyltransferase substrate binding protein (TIGR01987 family)
MQNRTNLKFEKFKKALISLEEIYLQPNRVDRSNIDATIQRFEFTFELCWKFLKDFFLSQGMELNYPKEVIKTAYQARIINNEEIWLQMLIDRNTTSHTYDEELANKIFEAIKNYVPELRKICDDTRFTN